MRSYVKENVKIELPPWSEVCVLVKTGTSSTLEKHMVPTTVERSLCLGANL